MDTRLRLSVFIFGFLFGNGLDPDTLNKAKMPAGFEIFHPFLGHQLVGDEKVQYLHEVEIAFGNGKAVGVRSEWFGEDQEF